MTLADRLRPCGPVADPALAARVLEGAVLEAVTDPAVRAALAPIAGASPYLGGIMRRSPALLAALLDADPDARLADLLARTRQVATCDPETARPALRHLKTELHLLTALCDLGGVWGLDAVTGALARFADTAVEAALAQGPIALMALETPANPTAAIVDIALCARIAAEVGERTGRRPVVSVDNTLLGPFAQAPLRHGADLCMTSLTKYCAGHSDLLAGGVSGSAALVAPIKMLRTTLGNHLDPYTAWLLLRSFETAALRTERAYANARTVATFLRGHPKVKAVTYLGFLAEGSPARAVYDRQCRAAGSTFSFELNGGEAEAFRMLDALRVLRMAVSLGGSETLICHSATTTHYAVPRPLRLASGITDGVMRLSVGIEHVDDLIEDLAQALDKV